MDFGVGMCGSSGRLALGALVDPDDAVADGGDGAVDGGVDRGSEGGFSVGQGPAADLTALPYAIARRDRRLAGRAEVLFQEGIIALPIRPPTVPEGTARLRLSVCAAHDPADLHKAADYLGRFIVEGN